MERLSKIGFYAAHKKYRDIEMYEALCGYQDIGLTPDEIRDHEEMFQAYRNVCGGKPPEEVEQALQDQAERERGCEMCRSLCKFCKVDNLDICDECKGHSKFVPREHENFCSNCGRDLRKLVNPNE